MAIDSKELQQASRRLQLRKYARQELSGPNKAQAFINIVTKAVDLVRRQSVERPATEVIEDIQQVLIGVDMRQGEGRGTGPYYVENPNNEYGGASGFKPEFQPDLTFQVQHAAAGLVIGFKYGKPGEWWARAWEPEPQDDALYSATAPLGKWLAGVSIPYEIADPVTEFVLDNTPFNTPLLYEKGDAYTVLPMLLLESVCDGSCKLPSDEDLRLHTSDASGDGFPDTSLATLAPDANASMAGEEAPDAFNMEADAAGSGGFNMEADAAGSAPGSGASMVGEEAPDANASMAGEEAPDAFNMEADAAGSGGFNMEADAAGLAPGSSASMVGEEAPDANASIAGEEAPDAFNMETDAAGEEAPDANASMVGEEAPDANGGQQQDEFDHLGPQDGAYGAPDGPTPNSQAEPGPQQGGGGA